MAHRFIKELKPGEMIEEAIYLCRQKDLRTTSQGNLYIHAVFADKTGQMVARMWQGTESIFNAIPDGGFVKVKGRTESYKGTLQFIIEGVRFLEEGEVNVADYLPHTTRDIDEMWSRVGVILKGIKNPHLGALVREFLADTDLMDRFKKAPAAIAMHHAYIGGLLEHTLSLLEVVLRVIPLYPKLDLDLVLTGMFLHDLGKTKELEYTTCIGYSDDGQLLGHITQCVMWIDRKADAVAERTGEPFPERLRWVLQHIVLSHHGQYEFGSPKLPAIPEAVAIHYLDNLDAKVNMFLAEIEKAPDASSNWTNYNRALETKIYRAEIAGPRGE